VVLDPGACVVVEAVIAATLNRLGAKPSLRSLGHRQHCPVRRRIRYNTRSCQVSSLAVRAALEQGP
jgi:hypothetical protein